MTGEEMQRAIEFVLEQQASLDQRIEQTNLQLAELGRRLAIYAETQSEFIEIATRSIQALAESQLRLEQSTAQLNASRVRTDEIVANLSASQIRTDEIVANLSASQVRTDEAMAKLSASQVRTDEIMAQLGTRQSETDARLDRITVLVERFVSGGRNGQE